jgi:hypothetical protein
MGAIENIFWQPSEKQSLFLSSPFKEVLYGGAAGGGKSDALLIDALGLQQGAIKKRKYQAIIFRRTFPDLKDLIDRSLELYPVIEPGAKYDKQAHVWTFPSGARVELGYLQYDSDRFKYRGRAFQYIGWDELTLFPTSVPYIYLLSRLRTVDPTITCYVRATTNPDGPGFKWVKDYFRIQTEGGATCFAAETEDPETGETVKHWRAFIPARLSDNPHLKDSGYRQTLLLLTEEEQRALLLGRWESPSIKGAYYAEQIEVARSEGRICRVPYQPGVPVHTYWDLGFNDTTAIWFHQHVGQEHRFIDYVEANGQTLEFFAGEIQDRRYVYGDHHLPHDAENKTLAGRGKSIAMMLREMLPNHSFKVVQRVERVQNGIEMTRKILPVCWFDEDKCANGIAALESYRKEWDDKLQGYKPTPLHDWASNGADAFRQFPQGYRLASMATPKTKSWRDRLKSHAASGRSRSAMSA